jgi:DNA-binding response OmpR family regulator
MRTHKILIADDSSVEAAHIQRSLDGLPGAQVTVVEDGAAALRTAKHIRFDLVLCDYEMPGLNGLQVVRFLRSTWSRLELPILMLTVRDDVQTKVLSLRQGANDYVTKPVEPEELLARVQGQLELKNAVEENIKARLRILEGRKLETIGRLAAGVAHELNTPAQFTADNLVFLQKAFSGTSELLELTREVLSAPPLSEQPWADQFLDFWKQKHLSYLLAEAPKALEESLNGVMRMARIVRDLKEFAGTPENGWALGDLNRAIENTCAVSRQLWSSVAVVRLQLEPELPQIPCDIAALKQAFFNILMTLVEAAEERSPPPRATVQIEISSRRAPTGIEIELGSDGPGIEVRADMFDPLTASEPGGGASHGLAVAFAAVVGQHGGQLTCESAGGRGTKFLLRLPGARLSS